MAVPPLDWQKLGAVLTRLLVAYVLALPIGWEREQEAHNTGLRTFPLVAVASCGYLLLAQPAPGGSTADTSSRILQGLIAGIGFIGGGAILKSTQKVRGTATAASIWNTGVIGSAVALDQFEVAIVLALLNLITLRLLWPLKARLDRGKGSEQPGPESTSDAKEPE